MPRACIFMVPLVLVGACADHSPRYELDGLTVRTEDFDEVCADSFAYFERRLAWLERETGLPREPLTILRHIPEPGGFEVQTTVSNSWSRHGQLWNAAIQAVRDIGESASINPKIAIHFTNDLDGQVWNFNNLINNGGVTDFDIMGISYYYGWHEGSITELQTTIEDLVAAFPAYEVIVAETGYPWTTQNYDQLGNIITTPDPEYLPVSPEKQLEYMVD